MKFEMENKSVFAVIDTNVIVSALLSSEGDSKPAIVLRETLRGRITPIFNEEILDEYREVLLRDKFHFRKQDVEMVINHVKRSGLRGERLNTLNEIFPDPKDVVFYEVAMSKEGAYLVTGNIKHFPKKAFVLTPAEMVAIISE
ncbi:MAG: putative toxin-antitoxin system toxin component, PIN family [Bacteroidales bacterium]|nr:putative toxin-antitoxin system toxin component, PIN family [Bacteroidales bacterium]